MDQDDRNRSRPDTEADRSKKRARGSGSTSGSKVVAAEVAAFVREEEEESMRRRGGVKTVTCIVCGADFYSMQAWSQHMETHSVHYRYCNPIPPLTNRTVGGEVGFYSNPTRNLNLPPTSETVQREEDEVVSSLMLLSSITPEHQKSAADEVAEKARKRKRDCHSGGGSDAGPPTAFDSTEGKGKEIVAAFDNSKDKGKDIVAAFDNSKDKGKDIVLVSSPSYSQPALPPLPLTLALIEDGFADVGASSGGLVFECSGCKRVFDSHQALGGHRASHKNIQGCYATEKKDQPIHDDDFLRRASAVDKILQAARMSSCAIQRKMYVCSVCAKAFTTGQALGGHMRWHLERNQYLGMAMAAAASGSLSVAATLSSFPSSSSYLRNQLSWSQHGKNSSRGVPGSGPGPDTIPVPVPSHWSSSSTSIHGVASNLQGIPGPSFSSNIIRPQSVAGNPTPPLPQQSASAQIYPTLQDLTLPRRTWISPGEGRLQQLPYGVTATLGFGTTFSPLSTTTTLPTPSIHLPREAAAAGAGGGGGDHQQPFPPKYQQGLLEWLRGGSSSRFEYILPRSEALVPTSLNLSLGNWRSAGIRPLNINDYGDRMRAREILAAPLNSANAATDPTGRNPTAAQQHRHHQLQLQLEHRLQNQHQHHQQQQHQGGQRNTPAQRGEETEKKEEGIDLDLKLGR